jgi:hypothetical protein
MRRDLSSKLYDGVAGRAGGGTNTGASARNRYATTSNIFYMSERNERKENRSSVFADTPRA